MALSLLVGSKITENKVILLQVQKGEMTEETRHNFKLCKALKMPTFELNKRYDNLDMLLENVPGVTMIIDAVFGTGFKGVRIAFISEKNISKR